MSRVIDWGRELTLTPSLSMCVLLPRVHTCTLIHFHAHNHRYELSDSWDVGCKTTSVYRRARLGLIPPAVKQEKKNPKSHSLDYIQVSIE